MKISTSILTRSQNLLTKVVQILNRPLVKNKNKKKFQYTIRNRNRAGGGGWGKGQADAQNEER